MMLRYEAEKIAANEVQDHRVPRAGEKATEGAVPGPYSGGPQTPLPPVRRATDGGGGWREGTPSLQASPRSSYTDEADVKADTKSSIGGDVTNEGGDATNEGGDAMAFDLDLPSDQEAARTKRLSYWALVLMGTGLVLYVSSVMMSIQQLYYLVEGRPHFYGLTYGAYDLFGSFALPLYGYWVDRAGTFKRAMMLGMALNALGNFVYAFTVVTRRWWMMLLGRALAGLGGASLGIGGAYITRTSRVATRQAKLGRYRMWQSLARTVGPIIGFLFLGLPAPTKSSSIATQLFNWYTLPGWMSGFVVSILGVLFAFAFSEPTRENQHYIQEHDTDTTERGDNAKHAVDTDAGMDADVAACGQDPAGVLPMRARLARRLRLWGQTVGPRVARFNRLVLSWMVLCFLISALASANTSNLFALLAGQYHGVWQQKDNWRVFVAYLAGAMFSVILYRRLLWIAPRLSSERNLIMLSNWLVFVGFILVIPFKGPEWVPPKGLFYTSTCIVGFANVMMVTNLEVFFSKKLTQYSDVVRGAVGRYMSAIFMAMSLGHFLGPLIIDAVTRISTPAGDVFYCGTGWIVRPSGDISCAAPPDTICGITASDYLVGGCVLYNAIPMYVALAVGQFVTNIWMHFVIYRNWSYDD